MDFEDALENELVAVTDLTDKVFPLAAKKDTLVPFLVYKKANIDFKKVLSGAIVKTEALYGVVIIANKYDQLQEVSTATIAKLLSFLGRSIGAGGPLIENVTVKHLGDDYIPEEDLYRANIQLNVKY